MSNSVFKNERPLFCYLACFADKNTCWKRKTILAIVTPVFWPCSRSVQARRCEICKRGRLGKNKTLTTVHRLCRPVTGVAPLLATASALSCAASPGQTRDRRFEELVTIRPVYAESDKIRRRYGEIFASEPPEGLLAASVGGARRVGIIPDPAVKLLWERASVVAASRPNRPFQLPGSATFG